MCNLSHFYLHHLKDIIGCIRGCYHGNPSPFSIDLIQAVSRQHEFNQKAIEVVNWQIPFGIARGIRQYHKFLGLMKRHPGETLVPTLEIGMWHVILYDRICWQLCIQRSCMAYTHVASTNIPSIHHKKVTTLCQSWRQYRSSQIVQIRSRHQHVVEKQLQREKLDQWQQGLLHDMDTMQITYHDPTGCKSSHG